MTSSSLGSLHDDLVLLCCVLSVLFSILGLIKLKWGGLEAILLDYSVALAATLESAMVPGPVEDVSLAVTWFVT